MTRVRIEALAFGGDAVGKDAGGRVVFVPGAVPGDEVDVAITEDKKRFARGEALRVVAPSPERVAPACPRFHDGCGGCPWMNVSLDAQRRAKWDNVRHAVKKLGLDVEPLMTPVPALGWRRRARFRYRGGLLGFHRRRSHELVDIDACPQLVPRLEEALGLLRRELLPRLSGEGEVHVVAGQDALCHVTVAGEGALGVAAAARALLHRAGIAGVTLIDGESATTVGAAAIDLGDSVELFWLAAHLFAQASDAGSGALRLLVAEAARRHPGAAVLELYAGSGNYTRDLARDASRVVAVEEHPGAVALGRRNLASAGLDDKVTWELAAAAAAVARLAAAGARFPLVVANPPRTGFEPGVAEGLGELATGTVVYVSCDPPTLVRDLAALAAAGLRTERLVPLDLMPQTHHVEVVAVLTAAPAGSSR